MTAKTENYAVSLSDQQWDLVVLALNYIRARARDPKVPHDVAMIDVFARRVLRKRLDEIVAEINRNVPDAGNESAAE